MTKSQESGGSSGPATGFRLSLDGWAVTLALALSLLIWAGLIKHIPW